MRTHTQAFKDGLKAYGRQFVDKIYYNSQTYTGDHIFSVNYSVDTSLCKSIMQVLKIDTDISMNIGDTLDYGISIVGVNGSEIRFNNFIVNKIEEQKDKKSKLITCYDNMVKSMRDYESFYSSTSDSTFTTDKNYYELDNGKYKRYTGARTGNPSTLGLYQSDFPMTIRTYLGKICTRLGITFGSSSDTFTNYNKQVLSEHYIDVDGNPMGYTYRDVLDDIAEATGSFISIDNNGQLEIKTFTTTNDTINEEFFNDKNVNIGEKVGPYNVVVLSRGDGSDNLVRPTPLPQTTYEFKIEGNPILDQTNREDFIDGIYNNINGLEFYANDFATKGILYLEAGDKYNVSIDSTTYPCLMLSDNIKRTQGLTENIVTKEPKETVTDYKYASSTDKLEIQSRNAYIIANKAEGSIEQVVSAIGDNGQVTTASIVQSINDSGSQIKLNADKIYINNVTFDQNQNMTITGGDIYLNDDGVDETDSKLRITSYDQDWFSEFYSSSITFHSNEYNSTGIFSSNGISLDKGVNATSLYPDVVNGLEQWIGGGTNPSGILRHSKFSVGNDFTNAIELEYEGNVAFSITNKDPNYYTNKMYYNGEMELNGNFSFKPCWAGSEKRIYWKEDGYGDQFAIIPTFNGGDDDNKLKIQGAVGGAGTSPTLNDLVKISGKSGNVDILGKLFAGNFDASNYWGDHTYERWVNNNGSYDQEFASWGTYCKLAKDDGYHAIVLIGNYPVKGRRIAINSNTDGGSTWSGWSFIEQQDDTGWQHLTMSTGFADGWNQGLFARKKNGIVNIIGYIQTTAQTSWGKLITTLPSWAVPTMEVDFVCRTTWNEVMKIAINTAGEVIVLNVNTGSDLPANEYIYLCAMYMN